jgi:hypothetical protein
MKVTLDLVKVIEQAAPQVYGGDERALLRAWLDRNAGNEQMVTIDIPIAALNDGGPTKDDPGNEQEKEYYLRGGS